MKKCVFQAREQYQKNIMYQGIRRNNIYNILC